MAAWEKVGNRLEGKWRKGRKISQEATAVVWLGREGNFDWERAVDAKRERDRFEIWFDLES